MVHRNVSISERRELKTLLLILDVYGVRILAFQASDKRKYKFYTSS